MATEVTVIANLIPSGLYSSLAAVQEAGSLIFTLASGKLQIKNLSCFFKNAALEDPGHPCLSVPPRPP